MTLHCTHVIEISWSCRPFYIKIRLNQPKCHFINSVKSHWKRWTNNLRIPERKAPRCLTIDKGLLFNYHVQLLWNKASFKLTVLARSIKIGSREKKKILMNAFIESLYLIMLNKRINFIYRRILYEVIHRPWDFTTTTTDRILMISIRAATWMKKREWVMFVWYEGEIYNIFFEICGQ